MQEHRLDELKDLRAVRQAETLASINPDPEKLRPAILIELNRLKPPYDECPDKKCSWKKSTDTTWYDWYEHWVRVHSSQRGALYKNFAFLTMDTAWFPIERSYYPVIAQLPAESIATLKKFGAGREMKQKLRQSAYQFYITEQRPLLSGETESTEQEFTGWTEPIKFLNEKEQQSKVAKEYQDPKQLKLEKQIFAEVEDINALGLYATGAAHAVLGGQVIATGMAPLPEEDEGSFGNRELREAAPPTAKPPKEGMSSHRTPKGLHTKKVPLRTVSAAKKKKPPQTVLTQRPPVLNTLQSEQTKAKAPRNHRLARRQR